MADTMISLALQLQNPAALRGAAALRRSALGRDGGPQHQVALGPSRARSYDVRRSPIEIGILEGEVLVTFEGDASDHVLAAGATIKSPRRGQVAVAAFRPSRFSVVPA